MEWFPLHGGTNYFENAPSEDTMKLHELFELYCQKRLRGRSQRTVELYRHSVKSFEKTVGQPATVDDLTDERLECHMWRLVNEGKSKATANKDHAQITAIWRFANKNRLVDTWPNVQRFQEPERVPLAWLPHEMDGIFQSIEREPGFVAGVPARLWWKCLISVLIETGERIGPMRKLSRNAMSGEYILVPAELRKRGTRDKLYKLTSSTASDLHHMLTLHGNEKLFPWDRSETYIYYRYSGILKRARLSHGAQNKFHALRRLCASIVKRMGGDAQSALDHASPRTTKRYLDPRLCGEIPTSEFIERYRKNG